MIESVISTGHSALLQCILVNANLHCACTGSTIETLQPTECRWMWTLCVDQKPEYRRTAAQDPQYVKPIQLTSALQSV
jgi:hypothetical protein